MSVATPSVLCLFCAAVWSIDRSKSCRNNYEGIWTFVHTLYEQQKGRLRAAGENGLQDISTLLPELIGFIDFLVVLPWRPCLPWKRINILPFVRSEMRIDGHWNLVNGLVSHLDLCLRRILCRWFCEPLYRSVIHTLNIRCVCMQWYSLLKTNLFCNNNK